MNLLAIVIHCLEISYTTCRSARHRHDSDITQSAQEQTNDNRIFHLKELLGREFSGEMTNTQMSSEPAVSESSNTVRSSAASYENREISDISKLGNRDIDSDNLFQRQKVSRETYDAESKEGSDMDLKLNREMSYFLTENSKVDKSLERYMKNFYFDMITLFQYEIKMFAEKELHARQHRRKHRKPSLRPKRSIRSLLKDAHIKDILMKYFQQKQKEENGKPLLRYG